MHHVTFTYQRFTRTSFGTLTDAGYVLPAMWLSLWTTMMPVGVMIGSLSCSSITDRFGTRASTIIGGFFAISGALLSLFSDRLLELDARRGLFTASKVVLGLGLGSMLPASQTYVSEVAPVRLRGALLSLFTISMVCYKDYLPSRSNFYFIFRRLISSL